jgi:hypothetical protein
VSIAHFLSSFAFHSFVNDGTQPLSMYHYSIASLLADSSKSFRFNSTRYCRSMMRTVLITQKIASSYLVYSLPPFCACTTTIGILNRLLTSLQQHCHHRSHSRAGSGFRKILTRSLSIFNRRVSNALTSSYLQVVIFGVFTRTECSSVVNVRLIRSSGF